MKTASRIMYIIGIIGNIIIFLTALICMIILIIAKVNPEFAAQIEEAATNASMPVSYLTSAGLGLCIYLVIASLIVLALSFRALKRGVSAFVHVILLIGGILCWDIFYVLGGIFGLISGK